MNNVEISIINNLQDKVEALEYNVAVLDSLVKMMIKENQKAIC